MKREKILEIAAKEIGVIENPANSNMTKYGEWFGFNGVAWCAMFVSWVYDQAGCNLGNIGYKKGYAGCQTGADHFKKNNQLTTDPQPGDIIFFDWNGDGRYDHTGIFVKKIDDKTFESIEGNTSMTNQSNGGQVMRRKRNFKNVIFASPSILNESIV